MHGLIDSQALHVRKLNAGVPPLRHLFGIVEALESDVLRIRKRVHSLDQRIQRKPDPRHDDGPCFDAPVSVDSLFERCDFEKTVQIEHLGLRDSAFDGDCPGDRAKVLRVMRGITLRGPELVEVVVAGHTLIRSRLLRGAELAFHRIEFRVRDCSAPKGAESYRCEKTAAVQVNALGRDRRIRKLRNFPGYAHGPTPPSKASVPSRLAHVPTWGLEQTPRVVIRSRSVEPKG